MALESWLALLKADVSSVSGVQATVSAGLGRYVTETPDVSSVSSSGSVLARDTSDTAGEIQTYQAQPAWALGCTGETADTCRKIKVDDQPETKQVFRKRGPWLTDNEQSTAQSYYRHHFGCRACIAAGRDSRYGLRCEAGATLWLAYGAIASFS